MTFTSFTWFDLSVVIAIVGISLKAGRILQKLDNVIEDIKGLKGYEVQVVPILVRLSDNPLNLSKIHPSFHEFQDFSEKI